MKIKILILFLLLLSGITNSLNAQGLIEGDSLFRSKKYTEAFEVYNSIYQNGEGSPAMLLKMSFIKEGLGDYTQALYYLEQYYQQTSSKRVLDKMRKLAEEHNLEGYEYSDYKFLINNIEQYRSTLVIGLLVIALLVMMILFKKKPAGVALLPWMIVLAFLLTPTILINNHMLSSKQAIVASDETLLMSGPSAGAEFVQVVEKGNKVVVLEHEPIWSRVRLNDIEGYVRTSRLLALN